MSFEKHSENTGLQSLDTSIVGHGAFPRSFLEKAILQGNTNARPGSIPTFNLADTEWREKCLSKASVPSGYTYLAQLMGHDLGNNVPLSAIPWSKTCRTSDAGTYGTYNLNETPLSLETIYARGPLGTPYLYEPKRLMFRIAPGRKHAEMAELPTESGTKDENIRRHRLLADRRNLDTVMLHELAVAWMQFHNLVARTLIAQQYSSESNLSREYYFGIYADTRAIVLQTWHTIILEDLLPVFCHPKARALKESVLQDTYLLSDVDALHGIMRAFHALPLTMYKLEEEQKHSLMDIQNPRNEDKWRINWDFFFGSEAVNKTALSASYSPQLIGKTGNAIALADLSSGSNMGAIGGFSEPIISAQKLLPEDLRNDLSARHLASLINKAASPGVKEIVTEADISRIPLFLLLMIEAQFYGENGGFGPFGSVLLRRYLHHMKNQINYIEPKRSLEGDWQQPRSMLDVINIVQTYGNKGN